MVNVPDVTVTPDALAAALKRPPGSQDVADALAVAKAVLGTATASAWRDIPQVVMDDMAFRVARAAYESRSRSSFGGGQATQVQGETAPRPPRDLLAPVGPVLGLYVAGLA